MRQSGVKDARALVREKHTDITIIVSLALVSFLRMNRVTVHTLPALGTKSNATNYWLCELLNLYETKFSHQFNRPENLFVNFLDTVWVMAP